MFLRSDEHLSTYWRLEDGFAHMNQFKFVHKQMEEFKLNFSVQNPTGNLNDRAIPIYFEKVLMYMNPDYRLRTSFRLKIRSKEIKRALKIDVFTSMCSSALYLFSFLDFFHENVMRTVSLVDNFFEIVSKYSAVLMLQDDS